MNQNPAQFIVLFGPPGAGKGTQSNIIAEEFQLSRVATGEIFRHNLTNKTELGQLAEQYLERGELVPDDVTIAMVTDTLKQPEYASGVMLDGFPRTIPQAEALNELVDSLGARLVVIFVRVPEDELVLRLSGRITCRTCDRTFHKKLNPPPEVGMCDANQQCDFYQRDDDKEELVAKRIEVYYEQTLPVLRHYDNRGMLMIVDGTQPIDVVTNDLLAALRAEKTA
jgi:adenylate kinase